MKINELVERLNGMKKGTYHRFDFSRICRVKKGAPEVVKHSSVVSRVGVDYSHIGNGENGGTAESHGLNGLEWETFPLILKNPKTKRRFLRLTTVGENPKNHHRTWYTINGKTVDYSEIEEYLYSSEKNHGKSTVFNVSIESIEEVK